MILDNDRRGYRFGAGMISNERRQFVLNIPKNASSFITNWTIQSGEWQVHTLADSKTHHGLKEVIIILRDPVDRWLSGFSQYACSWILNACRFFDTARGPGADFQYQTAQKFVESYNWVIERLIFDNLETFDDHVWPQTCFFQNLLPDVPRKYFLLDKNFDQEFGRYLDLPMPDPGLDRNVGNGSSDMRVLKQFLQARINAAPELAAALKQAYQQDYEIIYSLQCREIPNTISLMPNRTTPYSFRLFLVSMHRTSVAKEPPTM